MVHFSVFNINDIALPVAQTHLHSYLHKNFSFLFILSRFKFGCKKIYNFIRCIIWWKHIMLTIGSTQWKRSTRELRASRYRCLPATCKLLRKWRQFSLGVLTAKLGCCIGGTKRASHSIAMILRTRRREALGWRQKLYTCLPE